MIVCQCQAVCERDIAVALDNGARRLAEVCRATGAGRQCGICVLSIKKLVRQLDTRRLAFPDTECIAVGASA